MFLTKKLREQKLFYCKRIFRAPPVKLELTEGNLSAQLLSLLPAGAWHFTRYNHGCLKERDCRVKEEQLLSMIYIFSSKFDCWNSFNCRILNHFNPFSLHPLAIPKGMTINIQTNFPRLAEAFRLHLLWWTVSPSSLYLGLPDPPPWHLAV